MVIMDKDKISLGIDVGSVTLKIVLIDEGANLLSSSYTKHYGQPLQTLISGLRELKKEGPAAGFCCAAVTGSGRDLIGEVLGIPVINEIIAQVKAVARFHPSAKTIIEIGGQDSKFIKLEADQSTDTSVILDQRMNDICAAGTGAFVEQQAERMGVPIEEFGHVALESRSPALVAGRCAVFAKTDVIHLQQEGVSKSDIAAGICNAIARNYIAQFSKGREFVPPIIFQGGLAANQGVVKAFRDILKISEKDLTVPEHFKIMAAIGTAILALGYSKDQTFEIDDLISTLDSYLRDRDTVGRVDSNLPRLVKKSHKVKLFPESDLKEDKGVFIGIDVGSTSSCIAAINREKRLVAKGYVLNKGSLIESVNAALAEMKNILGDRCKGIHVCGAGVTGSGRYLVADYLGADVVRDEISAQAKAAIFILPDVDTVFEIGGQDSKYIHIVDGRVVEFEMNRVCAAGTGSFLQEQADKLNEDVQNFSDIAFASAHPVNLGSRCTVFMESDLIHYQQRGVTKEDLIAGLSYSVVNNYLEKVVGTKPIGDKIVMLGGVAFNGSVISAFEEIINKDIIVPLHHEVSAAIGMALIAHEELSGAADFKSRFSGFEPKTVQHKKIAGVRQGESYKFRTDNIGKDRKAPDIFKERERLLLSYWRPDLNRSNEKIGIPRALLFYELFPVWCVFLQELGYQVVVSDPTDKEIVTFGLEKTAIENCFANKVVYGHVQNLLDKKVDKLFMPSVIEFERRVKDLEHNYACPFIQNNPLLIDSSFDVAVLNPVFVRERREDDWQDELKKMGRLLNKPDHLVNEAVRKASSCQAEFRKECEKIGQDFLIKLGENESVFVIMGKLYNIYDPGLNLQLIDKLSSMGVTPFPFDCLPLSKQELPLNYCDMVWSSGQDLIRAAKIIVQDPRLYPLMITNFGCGPDSFTLKFLSEIFCGKPYLVLEVDEHTRDIGIITRCEAFLNNIWRAGSLDFKKISSSFMPFLPDKRLKKFDGIVYIPLLFDSFRAFAAAFESIGVRTKFLPPHDEETARLGKKYSSGKECLPFIMFMGDLVRMTRDPEFDPDKASICMVGSNLACRVSVFPTSARLILKRLGYPQVRVFAPRESMDIDEVFNLFGPKFGRNIYRGLLAVELLGKKLTQVRPYEQNKGDSDRIYEEGIKNVCNALVKGKFIAALDEEIKKLDRIRLILARSRPVIGLIGDDYTRSNSFINNNFIKEIESMGGEVWNIPVFSPYLEFQRVMKPRMMFKKSRIFEAMIDLAKSGMELYDKGKIDKAFYGKLKCHPDPDFYQMMDDASKYLDERRDPLLIIDIAHIIHLIKNGADGIVNVVGFQCIIHNIAAAMLISIRKEHNNIPTLTLYFDFLKRVHQRNRIEAFMYQVRQFKEKHEGL